MQLSIFLARFFGIYVLITGLFLFSQGDIVRKALKEFYQSPALMMVSGALNLMVGLLIVLSHSVWETHWSVIITVIGYLALLRGLLRFFSPFHGKKFYEVLCGKSGAIWTGIVLLIFGFFLAYKGFF